MSLVILPNTPVLVNVALAGSAPFPALLAEDKVLGLARFDSSLAAVSGAAHQQMQDLLAHWETTRPVLEALCNDAKTAAQIREHGLTSSQFQFHAPVEPRQVYCTIGNYRAQVIEAALDADDGPQGAMAEQRRAAAEAAVAQRRLVGEPYICLKGSSSVASGIGELEIEATDETLDWEVEIGVVIGRLAWKVSSETALEHVAGYCVVNDITLRQRIFRQDVKVMGTDWLQSKSRPGWLPAGPWLVPAWSVPDPSSLRLTLTLNGELVQDGVASDMIFTISEQIAYLSQHTPLEPGDLLCTGSPAGFGSHHKRFLRPGDLVEATVEGLGTQRVSCRAAL